MTEIAGLHGKTGLKTFVISGNHDSPERIGYFNKLIELNGIFTDGVFEGVARKNTVECDGEKVNIFSLPFIRPSFVRKVYPEESAKITDYTTAVRVVFEHSDINSDETNILIAHQFVTGSETSGSESSSVRLIMLSRMFLNRSIMLHSVIFTASRLWAKTKILLIAVRR